VIGRHLSAHLRLRNWIAGMSDDDDLMIQIQGGDPRAFEELVERYQGPLIGFFYRNTRDRQISEDLTQETLLRVFNQAWDYLPSGRFRGWAYRIARNLLIDNVRRQSHDALVHAFTGRHDGETDALNRLAAQIVPPEQIADQRELAAIVDELLKELPQEQRLTFTMHHFAGLSLSEVAEATGTSLPTCKSRLRLAREKLRHKLQSSGFALGEPMPPGTIRPMNLSQPSQD
jgi:RNA polymerase sigma-70 factor (ECF subfamily)